MLQNDNHSLEGKNGIGLMHPAPEPKLVGGSPKGRLGRFSLSGGALNLTVRIFVCVAIVFSPVWVQAASIFSQRWDHATTSAYVELNVTDATTIRNIDAEVGNSTDADDALYLYQNDIQRNWYDSILFSVGGRSTLVYNSNGYYSGTSSGAGDMVISNSWMSFSFHFTGTASGGDLALEEPGPSVYELDSPITVTNDLSVDVIYKVDVISTETGESIGEFEQVVPANSPYTIEIAADEEFTVDVARVEHNIEIGFVPITISSGLTSSESTPSWGYESGSGSGANTTAGSYIGPFTASPGLDDTDSAAANGSADELAALILLDQNNTARNEDLKSLLSSMAVQQAYRDTETIKALGQASAQITAALQGDSDEGNLDEWTSSEISTAGTNSLSNAFTNVFALPDLGYTEQTTGPLATWDLTHIDSRLGSVDIELNPIDNTDLSAMLTLLEGVWLVMMAGFSIWNAGRAITYALG